MKNIRPLVVSILFAASCNSINANLEQIPNSESSELAEFIKALISKNESEISSRYLSDAPSFTNNGRLNRNIYNFLYKDNTENNLKTIPEIIGDGDIFVKVIPQSDSIYTVLITKARNRNKIDNLSFLQSSWMIEYVACEFEVKDRKIFLYHNVCFAETGGPFPQESVF